MDYGGVLTTSVIASFQAFSRAEGIGPGAIRRLFREDEAALAEIHALERGELEEAEFERRFASRLRVEPAGLLGRMFAGAEPDRAMIAAVRTARESGLPTGLVSNSWGLGIYNRDVVWELFDAVVISGEVGLRKPDAPIFLLAAERLGLEPAECAMVDDLPWNVSAAGALGMAGVLHREAGQTVAELERLFGRRLRE